MEARTDFTARGFTYSVKVSGRWKTPMQKKDGFFTPLSWSTQMDAKAAAEKKFGKLKWLN